MTSLYNNLESVLRERGLYAVDVVSRPRGSAHIHLLYHVTTRRFIACIHLRRYEDGSEHSRILELSDPEPLKAIIERELGEDAAQRVIDWHNQLRSFLSVYEITTGEEVL